ncbi:unnamed protein product [Phytophthora lilii]|uniref:Unnamed protein product n=1 Tax=Phytophthora lilii TaxID=2077276 RepID=A0A9W6TML3_9STRA|nr:unnamed protein product [Phytophthora lilii]
MSSSRASSRGPSHAAVAKSERPRKITAKADELDAYMEKLYDDDVESKLEGAKMILQLAEFAGNIEGLVQNEALMVRAMGGLRFGAGDVCDRGGLCV